jgi:hypothetical protein
MSLEVTGKLLVKYDTVQVSEKFKKREFVIEIAEEINGNIYTNYGKFQLVQNKCDIIDRFNTGDTVKVSFNVKGNSYVDKKDGTTKYMTNLDAWRVESAGVPATPPPARPIDDTPTTNAMAGTDPFGKTMLPGSQDMPF